jgi:WD40 repeat protein
MDSTGDTSLPLATTPGQALRGYQLGEQLGEGAFAVVYRGTQPSVGRDVAVKLIRAELANRPEFVRRFEAEAHLVARLEHPFIVPLYDYWREPDRAYLVFRYLRGGTLEQRLSSSGGLPIDECRLLVDEVGAALSTAHAAGVVHRDVKPANVLLDEAGNFYLGDFGIALEAAELSDPSAALSAGSPAYASPEQLRRQPIGPSADVHGLGISIYEALTGKLPFPSAISQADLLQRQLHDPIPLVRDERPEIPAGVDEVLAKATAKEPADRFQTIDELVAEFRAAMDGSPAAVVRAGAATTISVGEARNPFKGLRAFTEADSADFFGRERLVDRLVEVLATTGTEGRIAAVVGPSGIGKSSVVRAGLLPALRRGAVAGSDRWFVATMLPGRDPFDELAAALLRVATRAPDNMMGQLSEDHRGIARVVKAIAPEDDLGDVLLVIDQFEELFTLVEDDKVTRLFLDSLEHALTDARCPLRVVLTMRADFWDRPLRHGAFARLIDASTVNVSALAPDELERAIVEPAHRAGAEFEPGLVSEIVADLTDQPGALPLLQYALTELWEQQVSGLLTREAYRELGGVAGALTRRAEDIYLEATPEEQAAVRPLFGRLVTPGEGTEDTRRRALQAELGNSEATGNMIDRYGQARLLSFDTDPSNREPTVEVAHEALIRQWPRLREWLDDDRDDIRTQRHLQTTAAEWDQSGKPDSELYRGGRLESADEWAKDREQLTTLEASFLTASIQSREEARADELRTNSRLRRLLAVVAIVAVVALIAGGLAVVAQREANDQAEAANAATTEAENQTRVAEGEAEAALAANERSELATLISRSAAQRGEDADVAVLLALEAHRRSPSPESEQAVVSALGSNDLPNRLSNYPSLLDRDDECSSIRVTDAMDVFNVSPEGMLITRDPLTGHIAEHGQQPGACVLWAGDFEHDVATVHSMDGLRMWIGPIGGPWDIEQEYDDYTSWIQLGLEDRIAIVSIGERAVLSLLDSATGEVIGTPIDGGERFLGSSAASEDGSLLAAGFATESTDDPIGTTLVIDAESGEELFRFSSDQPAAAMEFDMDAGELIAAIYPNSLMTIDLDTGDVVSQVELPTSADFLDIGLRPDGLVTTVVSNEILVIDRETGAAVSRRDIRNVAFAQIRPDGGLFTASAGFERTGVLELEGNALIRQTHSVDPFAWTTFNDGLVSAVSPSNGSTVEVIDLASGERSLTELVTADGERFIPHSVQPDRSGLWAIDAANVFTRWEGGRLVERLDLGGMGGAGTRVGDLYSYGYTDSDDEFVASLIDLGSSSAEVLFTVPTESFVHVHPTIDGGLFVLERDGSLFLYNAEGELVNEVPTTALDTGIITIEPSSGTIAAANTQGIVSIIDPATGDIKTLPAVEPISNLGFGRDGELLAITGLDGTVRLWDLERNASAGVVWSGAGSAVGSPSFYDPDTTSIWVASSGKLLNIPLDPAQWIEQACDVVARDLTQDEWDRFVPGDEPRQSACGREIIDEPVEAVAEPTFEIKTTFDSENEPGLGRFEVTIGVDEADCSAGSVLESGGPDGITNEFTCEGGPREGTFTIEWQIVDGASGPGDVNGPWTVIEATGDFAGLAGEGIWSGTSDDAATYGSFPGSITFDS